jgi:hypothetical protein
VVDALRSKEVHHGEEIKEGYEKQKQKEKIEINSIFK